jgi:hypothetical protein
MPLPPSWFLVVRLPPVERCFEGVGSPSAAERVIHGKRCKSAVYPCLWAQLGVERAGRTVVVCGDVTWRRRKKKEQGKKIKFFSLWATDPLNNIPGERTDREQSPTPPLPISCYFADFPVHRILHKYTHALPIWLTRKVATRILCSNIPAESGRLNQLLTAIRRQPRPRSDLSSLVRGSSQKSVANGSPTFRRTPPWAVSHLSNGPSH